MLAPQQAIVWINANLRCEGAAANILHFQFLHTYVCLRIWEQRRTHLGAETVVAGCRGERRWDGVQLCLLLRALTVVRTGFTEVGFYQW